VEHFHLPTGNPYCPMNVFITAAPIQAGDEIGLFDGECCVGAVKCSEPVTPDSPLEIVAAQKDGTGTGFIEGHPLEFRIWRKSNNEVITLDAERLRYLDPATGDPASPALFEGLATVAVAIENTVTEDHAVPTYFNLEQNFPNPFNPLTHLTFALPKAENVRLDIFDLSGKLVRRLVHGSRSAGYHKMTWDGTDDRGRRVASGVYFARLASEQEVAIIKMVFTK